MVPLIVPGVVGRIAFDPEKPFEVGFAAALDALAPADRISRLEAPGISTAAVQGYVLRVDDLCGVVSGNIDWLDYELADIQLKRGPARALLHAYRQHGDGLLALCGGRFAFLVWDARRRTGVIACDRFCQMPVYWAETADGDLVFAPTATLVRDLLGESAGLSEQAIFNYLYFHMVPGPMTVFRGVNKLLAAHALVPEGSQWRTKRYWEPDFRENADASPSEAAEEMLGLLASSTARLADGADSGAFLSGGLDSSTVAGLLARHRPHAPTYSIGFDASGYDEVAYAKIASRHFDTDFKAYYVTAADVLAELPKIAAAYDEPFGNSSALPAYFCARLAAADGRTRLLAGDGGDELFAGNERYAKQAVFERYAVLPRWSRQRVLEPLLMDLLPDALPLLGKARSYIQQANIPLPDRLQTYNFMNRFGIDQIVTTELLDHVDRELPMQLDRELYHHPRTASPLNRMLYLDWHHTLADNDLRKVNRMCQLAGIQVEYPMLDDRLVEFSTRVSSQRKMRHNQLRDFYKRAVRGFLPEEIINKSKHGFGLPFGVWLAEHSGLQELAAENLARMKRRGFVRADFVDRIVQLHRDQHAGYYGEFIWVLVMLELWLTAQGYAP